MAGTIAARDAPESDFGIALLARRLVGATARLRGLREAQGPRVGYFASSTGAAAALRAAAEPDADADAVVRAAAGPTSHVNGSPTIWPAPHIRRAEPDTRQDSRRQSAGNGRRVEGPHVGGTTALATGERQS
jgi:hypothetical protein